MGDCVSSQPENIPNDAPNKAAGNTKDINIERYHFGKTLGKGASCRVVEGYDRDYKDKKLAIKIMSKQKAICQTLYKHEVDILSRIEHKNIVQFINNTEDDSNYYVLTGLCKGGELFGTFVARKIAQINSLQHRYKQTDRIVDGNYKITEKIAAALIYDMLTSIQYLHSQNIVHRDLKPENLSVLSLMFLSSMHSVIH